jgi:glycosyltransferase involved in cell wall biosynthesis
LYGVPERRITTVSNGVDLSRFSQPNESLPLPAGLQQLPKDSVVLFFMGKLDYQPNREALAFLKDMVVPVLEKEYPDCFQIVVTGGPVPTDPFPPAFHFMGLLPDAELLGCLARADVCLAPIMTGSGTRLKILEYMAAAKPVVSTPKGAEGIECRNGEHIWIAEPADFARAILVAADSDAAAKQLGARARRLVAQVYDWDTAIKPIWREKVRTVCMQTAG